MLHDIVLKGSTDRSVTVRIIDSTDGTPETGVVFNTSGIDLWYRREGAAVTSITEATLASLTTAHSDGGFLHVSHGVYRLDLPDAAFATGANYVDFGGTVTGMIVIGGRVRLVDVNIEDTVRAGLTALPNAAAAASGGLFTRGTGAGQINQDANGRIDVNVAAISTDSTAADNCELMFDGTGYAGGTTRLNVNAAALGGTVQTGRDIGASVLLSSGTGTGQVTITSGVVSANAVQLSGDSTAADNAEAFFDGTGYAGTNNVIPTVTTVTTVNGLAANVITAAATAADFTTEIQSGLATAANLATVAGYLDTEIAAILADTNELQTDWANGGRLDVILDARASQASVDTIDGEVGDILTDTGTTLPATLATLATAAALTTVDNEVGAIDTVVDAIKAKTDQLTFTKTNEIDANVQSINGVTITGDGQTGTEFGV